MLKFFKHEELTKKGVNVRGISINKNEHCEGLDPKRLEVIKKYCIDRSELKDEPTKIWAKCVSAMNKKIYELKNKKDIILSMVNKQLDALVIRSNLIVHVLKKESNNKGFDSLNS